MKTAICRHWPALAAVAVLWVTGGTLFVLCIKQGRFVYTMDDVYIHMAIAKNFSQHGVWGVTRYEFSSSTSSMLWPLLLSLVYGLFGPTEIVPLILNIVFSTLAVCLAYVIMNKFALPAGYSFLFLLWLIFLTPLPAIIFTGMEHTLQVSLTIPFVFLAAQELASESGGSFKRDTFLLFVLAGLATLIRYEGLFLVGAVCLLFALRRKWLYCFGLGAVALIPIAVYAAISVGKGWLWLPNPVLLKAHLPSMLRTAGIAGAKYGSYTWSWTTAHVFALSAAALGVFLLRLKKVRGFWDTRLVMIAIFILATALHLRFAALGWFFRYEAYLVALGSVVLATTVCDYLSAREGVERDRKATLEALAAIALILLAYGFLVGRGKAAVFFTPRSSKNVHDQQYQMGLFVKQFYPGEPVAAGDIGCISYLGTARVVDLVGLAGLEVARERIKGSLRIEHLERLTKQKGAKVAIVYDRIFNSAYVGVPRTWIKVGQWTIRDNYICGDDTVAFFAVDPAEKNRLIANLRQFASRLPPDVTQSGEYAE